MYGIIDIGTGSIKASIYRLDDGVYSDVAFKSIDFRLIDPSTKQISQLTEQEAVRILSDLKNFVQNHNNIRVICLATYSLRSANSAEKFLKRVKDDLELDIHIITGEEEAHLIADSIRATEHLSKFFSFDIGGGSVEFNIFDGILVHSASANIGIINLAVHFQSISSNNGNDVLNIVRDIVSENLSTAQKRYELSKYPLICTGGSLIIASEILRLTNTINYETLLNFFEKIYPLSPFERIKIGIPPGKVDVFHFALAIALAMLDITDQRAITVSRANVRHGAAINHAQFL